MADHKRWFNEQPVTRAPEDEGVTLTSMGSMLTRLIAERDEKSAEVLKLAGVADAQADMIERLRAALASWLGEHTPQTMADHIDEDIRLYGDPNASNLDILYLRRNALRELQPGDLGRYE
jgi:hypothetical protein